MVSIFQHSSVYVAAMMPFWVYTLGKTFFTEDFKPVIPYTSMAQVMATFIVPLLIGVFIKWKSPHMAVRILKFLKPFSIGFMVIAMGVGTYSNWFIFKMFTPMYFLAGCMLPYIGYTLGGAAAILFRQPKDKVIAIALETGMQNIGIAFLLLLLSFPSPIGDIASIAPMASGVMTPLLPFVIFLILTIYRKIFNIKPPMRAEEVEKQVIASEKVDLNGDAHEKVELMSNETKKPLHETKTSI